MYLKTLTIRGFKSFASKTTFEFEPGITSVIGPNGSGKSNVVDALAWVMGEQGVKNLRGGKMEDVIFAGTTGRSPLGRAQVELTIDNSDGTLPIDYSEVTISRTLFRAGGSEYQINGQNARLLDIQELLSDSGLGREMHVIVGQGQLDRILQATPEERRGFIEEAAGILKHRRRKERSERKLESMRGNLDRIRDLTDEVHRQLGPLSQQADTARRAQRIQHDVQDASARLLADEVVTQTALLAERRESDKDLETRQQELTAQLQQSEATSQYLAEKFSETTQAAGIARDHKHQLTALAERFRSLQALVNERLKTASRPAVASSGLSPEDAAEQLAESEEAYRRSEDNLETLRQALQEAQEKREAAERGARVARETYTQLVREEADQQKALARAENRKHTLETKLQSLTAELDRLESDATHSSESFEAFQQEIAALDSELSAAEQELSQRQHEVELAREQTKNTRSALAETEKRCNELNNEVSGAQARVEVLEEALQPEPGSAQAALHEYGPYDLASILEIEPGWEVAITALLAGAADRLWLEDTAEPQRLIDVLDQHNVSDVRIFHPPTGELSQPPNDAPGARLASQVVTARQPETAAFTHIQHLLSCALVVDSLADAQDLIAESKVLRNQPHVRVATKQGHIFTAQWMDYRGAGGASSLERRAQYDHAVTALESLSTHAETAERAHAEAKETYEQARHTVEQQEAKAQSVQSQVTTLRERVAVQKRHLEQQTAAQQRQQQQRQQLCSELEQVKREFDQAQEHFDALQTASALTETDATSTEGAAEAQRIAEQDASATRAAETEARLALRIAENTAQQAEHRVEQARRRLSAAKIAQQEYQRALVRQRQTVQRLTGLKAGIETAIEYIRGSIDRADHDSDALEQQRADLQREVESAERAVNTARRDLAKLQEQLHERRLVRQEHELKLEQLHDRALNELGYSHQYLVQSFGPDQPVETGEDNSDEEVVRYNRAEQQKRLRTAKRQLKELGKINPLALEEYTAVQERYEYLTQQLADLEESRRNLLKIIEDVNATVLEVFTSAYEDTAAQFEHVFATLFPGGEGRLSLTEPDNMLETGIEVEARPAGKKVKRLSLLSGGERSLAAIALLVSIFKARPSPFYVMDEVEAALDDTNLTRLLTILKELQHDSQLIIITHQKRTMEISDALYGVSMRGDGVSQVISQKLEQT